MSMTKRTRKLSYNWYPDNPVEIKKFILNNMLNVKSDINAISAIVPHAGWSFSGSLVVKVISFLYSNPDVIIVIGGHLPSGSPVFYSPEEVYETPLGYLQSDKQFLTKLISEFDVLEDKSSDNTVEVLLPIIKYFYPDKNIICLRIGSGNEAINLGSVIYQLSQKLKKSVLIIGSTDLTHYGRNFNFSPQGTGNKAVKWVKEVNDKAIIKQMLSMDYKGVLDSAMNDFSACSPGAVSAALRFAVLSGRKKGKLIGYLNSYDILPSDSFVGYAGIVY